MISRTDSSDLWALLNSRKRSTRIRNLHFIEQEDIAAQAILRQIEFTKNYQDIGIHAPIWQDIGVHQKALQSLMPPGEIEVSVDVAGLEIYADPLLEKVFENLIDNSRRHGERVRHISVFLSAR